MAHYSIVVIAHDELHKIGKDPNFGKKLEDAILKFSTEKNADGQVVVHRSSSVVKVVSSFNADIKPKIIVSEGWHCYDIDVQTLPGYLMKFVKNTLSSLFGTR